jgi:hypothetical protein
MRQRQPTLLSSAQLAPRRIAQLPRLFCYSWQVSRREDVASFGIRYPKVSKIKLVTLFSHNDNNGTPLVLAQRIHHGEENHARLLTTKMRASP